MSEYEKTMFDQMISSGNCRLDELLKFSAVIDRMTGVFRRTLLIDRSRCENDAEHSWHIAVMALIFKEFFTREVDVPHAVEMLLVHDLVEIYAGDTFAYDTCGNQSKAEREKAAADRLFGELPDDTGKYLRALWEEFDGIATPDACYANCLDRLQPFLHNILTGGHTWRNSGYHTSAPMVRRRMSLLTQYMPEVGSWVENSIANAVKLGQLANE